MLNKYIRLLFILLITIIIYSNNTVYAEEIIEDNEIKDINNSIDSKTILDNILEEKEINETNDINNDNKLDINDVTNAIYIEETDKLENDNELSDTLTGELSKNDSDVYLNDEVNVDFYIEGFKNDTVNGIEGNIEYNKDKLVLLGIDDSNTIIKYGGINKKDKFIYILDNYNVPEKVLSFKFKTINTGIGIVSINNLIISSNGLEFIQNNDKINLSMMINNYPKETSIINNFEDNSIKPQSIVLNNKRINNKQINNIHKAYAISDTGKKISISHIKLSNDNFIKQLIIKNHKINFSKDKLEYNIKVDGNTNKLDIQVILNDNKAIYEIIGNKDFKAGENKVYIAVTAEDGKIRNYIINVKKSKKQDYKRNSSRNVIIVLLILIVIGLIYIIFKEDEEEN